MLKKIFLSTFIIMTLVTIYIGCNDSLKEIKSSDNILHALNKGGDPGGYEFWWETENKVYSNSYIISFEPLVQYENDQAIFKPRESGSSFARQDILSWDHEEFVDMNFSENCKGGWDVHPALGWGVLGHSEFTQYHLNCDNQNIRWNVLGLGLYRITFKEKNSAGNIIFSINFGLDLRDWDYLNLGTLTSFCSSSAADFRLIYDADKNTNPYNLFEVCSYGSSSGGLISVPASIYRWWETFGKQRNATPFNIAFQTYITKHYTGSTYKSVYINKPANTTLTYRWYEGSYDQNTSRMVWVQKSANTNSSYTTQDESLPWLRLDVEAINGSSVIDYARVAIKKLGNSQLTTPSNTLPTSFYIDGPSELGYRGGGWWYAQTNIDYPSLYRYKIWRKNDNSSWTNLYNGTGNSIYTTMTNVQCDFTLKIEYYYLNDINYSNKLGEAIKKVYCTNCPNCQSSW